MTPAEYFEHQKELMGGEHAGMADDVCDVLTAGVSAHAERPSV